MELNAVKAADVSATVVGVISEPWYRNELVRWLVPLVVSLAMGWLANRGITPAPVPPLPTPAPSVLVLNVGAPVAPSTSPVMAGTQK